MEYFNPGRAREDKGILAFIRREGETVSGKSRKGGCAKEDEGATEALLQLYCLRAKAHRNRGGT